MQKLTVSKCCASPLLVRGGDEGTKWMTCASCKNPADRMSYPFTTVGQMERWVKARRTTRGLAYTASTVIDRRPKSCLRSNMGYLFCLLMFLLVGILIAFAAR